MYHYYKKYYSRFKYDHKKSHKVFLEDIFMFSLEDKNINILNSLKGVDRLNYERDLLERIIFPISEKYEDLTLDVYEKKCLFVLAFVYILSKTKI